MTRRKNGAGVVAVGVLAAAWLVGSTALGLLGLGLALAALGSRAWARLVGRRISVERRPLAATRVEGQPLRLEVVVAGRRWLASRAEWIDHLGPLGERRAPVGRSGVAALRVDGFPRGRYRLGPGRLALDDPLGLGGVEVAAGLEETILVRPQVPELRTLFTEAGAWGEGGRRAMLRRPSGLEPHGVREYVEGEPLRAVHWPTSARRGQLMVRDLEDAPRDSVAVVLDLDASTVAGPPGDSSLDDAVRAAAGLLRAHAARARSALLVLATVEPELHRIRSLGRDWESALDALAGAEPAPGARLSQLLSPAGLVGRVPDVVVVTARPDVVAAALVSRLADGHSAALVAVDAPTYAGRAAAQATPGLLRLAAAGAPIAVLRHGRPLIEALGGLRAGEAAAG